MFARWLPGFDEDVLVLLTEETFTDELLGDGDGLLVGYTQVRQVVQESE